MVHLTVGVGGNYSGWVACYNYLSGLGALADDYEIEQISNITITNWPSILTTIRLNGHYVRFYVAWENSHQGNPTRGYVTSLNGVNGVFRPYNSSLSLTGSFILENLYFRQITNTANMLVDASRGAAAVCGVFWGWLYLRFRSPVLNIVSHTLWDLAVFVVFPF